MKTFRINRSRIAPLMATLLVAAGVACAPQQNASDKDEVGEQAARPSAPRVPEQVRITVPGGTEVHVTLSTAVGSETSRLGDSLTATTMAPILVGDRVAIPSGSTITGRVTEVAQGTKGLDISEKGGSVVLSFDRVTTPSGTSTPISATIARIAKSKGKTAGIIGGSAAGGALLGKILGGSSKDAAVGAAVGAGIGTGIAAGTKGKALELPAGTELTMTLDQAVTLTQKS